jgi:hypothetical protein
MAYNRRQDVQQKRPVKLLLSAFRAMPSGATGQLGLRLALKLDNR